MTKQAAGKLIARIGSKQNYNATYVPEVTDAEILESVARRLHNKDYEPGPVRVFTKKEIDLIMVGDHHLGPGC